MPQITAQPATPLNIRGVPLPIGIHVKTDDIDTTEVPMDLEPELVPQQQQVVSRTPASSAAPVSQTDIENELREFLEGGSAGTMSSAVHDGGDGNVLDQIMMH